ncbi:hypothetical protein GXW82_02125 [Streptacidiphilus sp. 4-A2]|nr:hypothetical protein [Streptacidiphilus sp. 4-A2]
MTDEGSQVDAEQSRPMSGAALPALMAAQAVSVTGTQITALALPTLAILVLHAGPLAASLLFALEYGSRG